jgi:hypothetical protein
MPALGCQSSGIATDQVALPGECRATVMPSLQ